MVQGGREVSEEEERGRETKGDNGDEEPSPVHLWLEVKAFEDYVGRHLAANFVTTPVER